MTQSDMAETLAEIYKIDPNFDKEVFVKECQFEIIPTVLEAYLQGRQDIIKDWCHEGVCALIRIITSLIYLFYVLISILVMYKDLHTCTCTGFCPGLFIGGKNGIR